MCFRATKTTKKEEHKINDYILNTNQNQSFWHRTNLLGPMLNNKQFASTNIYKFCIVS